MAKANRYAGEDGSVVEGQNSNIGDDTRARALKWAQEQSDSTETEESTPAAKTTTKATKTAKTESKAERKGASVDDEAGKSRGRPAEGEPKTTSGATRTRTKEEVKAAIPTGGKAGAGPTPGNGNSVEGSELSRNVKNTLMAMGPTRLAGLSNAAAEGAMTARAASKATQAARSAREAKTLNPNAWMAGPKGMKENFKSGGGVKGWGIARGSRAAKTY
jgi:hypothetical protein